MDAFHLNWNGVACHFIISLDQQRWLHSISVKINSRVIHRTVLSNKLLQAYASTIIRTTTTTTFWWYRVEPLHTFIFIYNTAVSFRIMNECALTWWNLLPIFAFLFISQKRNLQIKWTRTYVEELSFCFLGNYRSVATDIRYQFVYCSK